MMLNPLTLKQEADVTETGRQYAVLTMDVIESSHAESASISNLFCNR